MDWSPLPEMYVVAAHGIMVYASIYMISVYSLFQFPIDLVSGRLWRLFFPSFSWLSSETYLNI